MNEEAKQVVEEIKKSVVETVTPAITEKVLAEVEAKQIERKTFGSNAEQELAEQKEVAAEYLRKKATGQETKGLTAGGSSSGAELVPTYVASEIVRLAEQYGLVRRFARRWPMQGSNVNVPTASSVTAYRVNEGAKITSSAPTTGAVALTGKTVGVMVPVSKKLLRNATPAVVDMINKLAAEAIAKLEDQWALLGLGATEGVFQGSNVSGVTMGSGDTTYAKATAEDLLDVINYIDENAADENLRWVMSLSVLNVFRALRASVGADAQNFLFGGFGQTTPSTLWDIPYSLSSVMPKTSASPQAGTKFIALTNFNYIIHGDAQQYTMDVSEQATVTDTNGSTLINLWEQEMAAVKVVGEIDIQVAEQAKAHAWLKTAAS